MTKRNDKKEVVLLDQSLIIMNELDALCDQAMTEHTNFFFWWDVRGNTYVALCSKEPLGRHEQFQAVGKSPREAVELLLLQTFAPEHQEAA